MSTYGAISRNRLIITETNNSEHDSTVQPLTNNETRLEPEEEHVASPVISAEVCIIIYSFIYSLIAIVQLQYVDYIERLDSVTLEFATCTNESSSEEYAIQTRVNLIVLGLVIASSVPSFCTVPLLSQISLRIGYKRGLVINLMFLLVSCCIWLISVSLQTSYLWLVVAQFVSGVGGGIAGSQALVTAYLSLIYDEYHLTKRLAVTGALIQLSMGTAQFIAGYAISDDSFTSSFIIATLVCTAGTVYSAVYIKNIRPISDTTGLDMFRKIKLLIIENSTAENRKVALICFVLCMHWSINRSSIVIAVLYVLSYPFCWGSETIGYFLVLLFGLGTIGPLLVFFGTIPDLYLALLGIASTSIFVTCCAIGSNTEVMFIGAYLCIFRAVVVPSLLACLSKMYPHPKSKVVLAMAGCSIAIAEVIAPGIYQTIYGFTLQISTAIVFCCMLFVYIPCALIIGTYAGVIPCCKPTLCEVQDAVGKYDDAVDEPLHNTFRPLIEDNAFGIEKL